MTDIFLVVASGGFHDSAWHANISAFTTAEEAEAECVRLRESRARAAEMRPVVLAAYQDYLTQNPAKLQDPPARPKGPSKPTRENMVKHQKEIELWQATAAPITKSNGEEYARANIGAYAAARAKAVELGADKQMLEMLGFTDEVRQQMYIYSGHGDDTFYDVEPLELIDSI